MSSESHNGNSSLESLIARYLEAEESGQNLDRKVLIEEHPQLAQALREFFANHDRLKAAADLDKPALPPGGSGLNDPTISRSVQQEGETLPPQPVGDGPTLPQAEGASNSPGPSVGDHVRYFGDYELLEEIARGGMGVVFRALQVKLNRIVALKMILAGQFAGQEDVQRFHTEAEAAANLDHPGIVPIFEIGEHEGQHYFSMGYIEGESLAQRIADGPLPPREAAELSRKICDAVAYAHERGVIHRDLKPANILIDKSGQPKVTDFGLAKKTEADSNLTGTGQILGTPAYMPPEQASGKTDVGLLADVYSLGAVLYYLLTGRPPFQAATPLETLYQVSHCELVPPRQLNPDVDRDLDTICCKCLEKQPERRYATAGLLADELARFLRGEPIHARPASTSERLVKWIRRRPAAAALLTLSSLTSAFLIILIVGYSFHRQLQREKVVADRQRDAARQAKNQLAQKMAEVERQKELVSQQKSLVESERDRARRIQYASDMNMADRAWRESQVGRMFGILRRHVPQGDKPDLRGFEWYYLWRQGNWQEVSFRGTRGAQMMAFAPDVQLAATGGFGKIIDLWDVATFSKRATITAGQLADVPLNPNDMPLSVALTPDGKTLAIGFHGGELVAWDCEGGQVVFHARTGFGRRGYVNSVDVTDDGKLFVAGDSDGGVRLWDRDGQLIREFKGHQQNVTSVRFSPDERRLATACSDYLVVVWDVSSGEPQNKLSGHTGFAICVAWSPDGKTIAGGAYNEEIRLWDVETGEVLHVLRGHRGSVNDVAFHPAGQTLASAAADGTIRLWDVASGNDSKVLRGHSDYIHSVAWTRKGERIVSSSRDGSTRVWLTEATPDADIFDDQTPLVSALVISPDGSRLATARRDGAILLLDSVSGEIVDVIQGPSTFRKALAFHPDGRHLAVSGDDGTVRLWDTVTGTSRELAVYAAGVADLDFSPDGKQLVAGCDDKTARVLDVESGNVAYVLDQHQNSVWAVAWSPDGKWIATGGHDGTLILWDAATGESAREWSIFNFPSPMIFSPDSKLIAVPSKPRGVDLISLETGELVQSLQGHSDSLGGIAFSPDGSRVFTSSWDRTVKVWDPVSGQETLTLPSDDKVNRIVLGPDGRHLFGIGDHTVTRWTSPQPPPHRDAPTATVDGF